MAPLCSLSAAPDIAHAERSDLRGGAGLGCARMRSRVTMNSAQQGLRMTGGMGPSSGPNVWSHTCARQRPPWSIKHVPGSVHKQTWLQSLLFCGPPAAQLHSLIASAHHSQPHSSILGM